MEKAYKAENNPSYEIIKKTKNDNIKENSQSNVLSMLPVIEDKDSTELNYSKTEFNLQTYSRK